MYTLTQEAITQASINSAVRLFFCNIFEQEQIDWVWSLSSMDEEDARQEYAKSTNAVCVWQPFESWDLIDVLDHVAAFAGTVNAEIKVAANNV